MRGEAIAPRSRLPAPCSGKSEAACSKYFYYAIVKTTSLFREARFVEIIESRRSIEFAPNAGPSRSAADNVADP